MSGVGTRSETGYILYFQRLSGEVITLTNLSPKSRLEDVRKSILQQLPSEPEIDLTWFFYAGMPLMHNGCTLADCGIKSSATICQYHPDIDTMVALGGSAAAPGVAPAASGAATAGEIEQKESDPAVPTASARVVALEVTITGHANQGGLIPRLNMLEEAVWGAVNNGGGVLARISALEALL